MCPEPQLILRFTAVLTPLFNRGPSHWGNQPGPDGDHGEGNQPSWCGLRGFLGHGTSRAKARTVQGKPGCLVSL